MTLPGHAGRPGRGPKRDYGPSCPTGTLLATFGETDEPPFLSSLEGTPRHNGAPGPI